MKYQIIVRADTKNVLNIFIDQEMSLILKCSRCNVIRENAVDCTLKPLQKDNFSNKYSEIMKCHECKEQYGLKIDPALNHKHITKPSLDGIYEEVNLSIKKDNYFVVTRIETFDCEIYKVNKLIYNVLCEDKNLYRNIQLDGGFWSEIDKSGKSYEISDLQMELVECPRGRKYS
ncbi:hypothetical protein EDEG_00075 [Edhazardia aedis USNM 41457]|uniref:DUF866 domain-containing protein n=1 Tax=Edhazardia aedis (strain USNM 41457) TaxID=1003232 RepID=J8ZZ41_EDHAE|nr:hypothetical protein EDEG_00075 [Edhazardia aedis USNM 41457]|eukprot:EJW04958.1 hypothetical protein EDEG_00075 [Edhazardia aedis USNM 41457]